MVTLNPDQRLFSIPAITEMFLKIIDVDFIAKLDLFLQGKMCEILRNLTQGLYRKKYTRDKILPCQR